MVQKGVMNEKSDECPLCLGTVGENLAFKFKTRIFKLCHRCFLIFCDRPSLPSSQIEKARYLQHQNHSGNSGYIAFLNKIIDPMLKVIDDKAIGLDYGCGPTWIMSELLSKYNIKCEAYDPYFNPDISRKSYDFLIASEVVEHFHFPHIEFRKMIALLNDGGYLAIMTELWYETKDLANWHYIRDITHVSFYHQITMQYLGKLYGLSLIYSDNERVLIFQKARYEMS